MKLSPIVLKLRLAETRFSDRIAGIAEIETVLSATVKKDMAFVAQISESVPPNQYDNHISQLMTERFAVIVALANDSSQGEKTGIIAFDQLYEVRNEIFNAILGWQPDGAESIIFYAGGRLLDANRAYLWYQFEFDVQTDVSTMADNGADALESFNTIYADIVNAEMLAYKNARGRTVELPVEEPLIAYHDDLPLLGDLPVTSLTPDSKAYVNLNE